jgi:uncharacterized protein (TIGR02246 family)
MPSDQTAIESLISGFVQAANTNELQAFAAIFAEDAEFTNMFGQRAKGRTAIEKFHAPLFSEQRQDLPSIVNAELKVLDRRIRFLRPDVAAVDVNWQQTGAIAAADGQPWGSRIGLSSWVVTREEGVWAIAVMHNMDLPVAPGWWPGGGRFGKSE